MHVFVIHATYLPVLVYLRRPETSFTVTGFRNWKKATGKNGVLSRHVNSISHKSSEVAWQQYKLNLQQEQVFQNGLIQIGQPKSSKIDTTLHHSWKHYCIVPNKK